MAVRSDTEAARLAGRLAGRFPQDAEIALLQALALLRTGRATDAEAAAGRAAALAPEAVEPLLLRGQARARSGDAAGAADVFAAALSRSPGHPAALAGRVEALRATGDREGALETLARHALPGDRQARVAAAVLTAEVGRLDAAIPAFEALLSETPDDIALRANLAEALLRAGRRTQAATAWRDLAERTPGEATAWAGLGRALAADDRPAEAADALQRALSIEPDLPAVLHDLGAVLVRLARPAAALEPLARAAALAPSSGPTAAAVAATTAEARLRCGEPEAACRLYARAIHLAPDDPNIRAAALFCGLHDPAFDPADHAEAARALARRIAASVSAPAPAPAGSPARRPLSVALLSPDFRAHPVGWLLTGTLESIDPSRLRIACWSTGRRADDVTDRLRAAATAWHDVADPPDAEVAAAIRSAGTDILVDLTGPMRGHRLGVFARRPAPVQVAWLGYEGTTGLPAIGHLLAGQDVLPPEDEPHFAERIHRMPGFRVALTPPDMARPERSPPAVPTFGSFNRLAKLNDGVVRRWSTILGRVPESRLLLKAPELDDLGTADRLRQRFGAHGIAGDRLLFRGATPRRAHLAAMASVDLALDTFPYPGVTTTLESLWAGTPVLALAGWHFHETSGAAILRAAGLDDWVALDPEDYVRQAVARIGDRPALEALRRQLPDRLADGGLVGGRDMARRLTEALEAIWRESCETG